jgi:hypothetical protein
MAVRHSGTVHDLVETLGVELSNKGFRHLLIQDHQAKSLRTLKPQLDANSCLFLIHFSENDACKYHREAQSMHFGAARDSATIHDGVLYTVDPTSEGKLRAQSFATISNSTRHDAVAVWTYLKPVISWALQEHQNIQRIHFKSDGPVTQNKGKENFYLFSTFLHDHFPELQPEGSSWLFSAAGHGKNAADGIGATCKQTADRLVAQGKDIPDARTLFEELTSSKLQVKLFYTSAREVEDVQRPTDLKTLEGSMKIHQLNLISRGTIMYRQMACFCKFPEICECNGAKSYCFNTRSQSDSSNTQPIATDSNSNEDGISNNRFLAVESDLVVGTYCITLYDDRPYIGKVQSLGKREVEVNVMYQRGQNKFAGRPRKTV